MIAECCKPIPGDDVLGYIGDNNRIIIHKRQCPLATKLKSSYGNRLLAVQWETGKSLYFPVNIYIKGIDHIGLLNKVTEIISQQLNVNIHKLNIESNDGIFEGRIQLFVHDVDDVKSITTNLRKIDEIKNRHPYRKVRRRAELTNTSFTADYTDLSITIICNSFFNPCNLW